MGSENTAAQQAREKPVTKMALLGTRKGIVYLSGAERWLTMNYLADTVLQCNEL